MLKDLVQRKDAFNNKYQHLKKPTGVEKFDVRTLAADRIQAVGKSDEETMSQACNESEEL